MRKTPSLLLTGLLAGVLACSESLPTSPDTQTASASSASERVSIARPSPREISFRGGPALQPGVWGSEIAILRIAGSTARLEILASGGCFGTYGDIDQAIPNGLFTLPGSYTQLMGVYPGKTQYAAVYTGGVQGDSMSITITVPSLSRTFGPFRLAHGVDAAWGPCLYP